eukprot:768498-Hanusia_phi.AAC.2
MVCLAKRKRSRNTLVQAEQHIRASSTSNSHLALALELTDANDKQWLTYFEPALAHHVDMRRNVTHPK